MAQVQSAKAKPAMLDVVALLRDVPSDKLGRGQVGTVVEVLDEETNLVEFTDDDGRAYATVPCKASDLIVLYYDPQTA